MHTLAHCCIAGPCCAPGSEEQISALADMLEADLGLGANKNAEQMGIGRAVAEWIDSNNMALVPKELAVAMHSIFAGASRLKRG
jgi:hypothetical protein